MSSTHRLLLIEDEDNLRTSLRDGLVAAGFHVDMAADGADGWELAANAGHDLILLDRMLPKLDGLEILRRMRRAGSAVPVLLLTARDTITDRVEGLDAGADDYLVKPFAVAELLARIHALLRRGAHRADPMVRLGDLEVDTAARAVRRGGRRIDLTPREYAVLDCLIARAGSVVTRLELADALGSIEDEPASNVIDVLIARLRRKLQPAGTTALVHTRRGFGYVLSTTAEAGG